MHKNWDTLVEGLDSSDSLVLGTKLVRDSLHNRVGASNVGRVRMPCRKRDSVARVIEPARNDHSARSGVGNIAGKEYVPVLAPRCAVQVNDQLEAVITGPGDRVSEISKLSLYVRFSRADLPCPISYREPYVVQPVSKRRSARATIQKRARRRPGVPSSCNSFKVRFGYPGVPMVFERLLRRSSVLQLPKRPLVDDVRVSSVIE